MRACVFVSVCIYESSGVTVVIVDIVNISALVCLCYCCKVDINIHIVFVVKVIHGSSLVE